MHERPTLSRRQFLGAAALGTSLGALGLGRFAPGIVDAGELSGAFNEPGTALQPAQRQSMLGPYIDPPPPGMLIFPVDAASDCYVLDNFGDCRGSGCTRRHEGIDIMGSKDQAVLAVAAGRLTKRYVDSGLTSGAGNGWTLHDEANDVVYKYFHLARHATGLGEGDAVRLGQVIGYVGNTGTSGAYSNSNYHLHFEFRPGDVPVDALPKLVIDRSMCGVSPPIGNRSAGDPVDPGELGDPDDWGDVDSLGDID